MWEIYHEKYEKNPKMQSFVLQTLLVIYGARKAHLYDKVEPEYFVFLKNIAKNFPIKYYATNQLLVYTESAQELVDMWKQTKDANILGQLLGFKCLFHDSKYTKYITTIYVRYKKEFYYITSFMCNNSNEKETIKECKKDYTKAVKSLGPYSELLVVVEKKKKYKKLPPFKDVRTSIGTIVKSRQIYKGYTLDEEKDSLVKVDLELLYLLMK